MHLAFRLIAFVLSVLLSASLFANDQVQLDEVNSLGQKSEQRKLILSIPDDYYQADKPNFIALPPDTKQVNITAQDIRYEKEAESFARHRKHYVAFWSVFMIMFGVDILWAE